MRGRAVIIFVIAGALAAAALLAASTRAALSGEVIVASDTTLGKRAVMSAVDGSGLTAVDCGGDLTQGGQPRYFVHAQATGGPSRSPTSASLCRCRPTR